MNISSALQYAAKKLKAFGSSVLDAEVLLSFTIKKPKEFILAHPETNLTAAQEKKFRQLASRRAKGEPIAYLTGHKEFYGLDFFVNRSVLIPRPETEMLVDEIIKHKTWNMEHGTTFIDVGTGSGCIAITLAKLLPRAKIIAVDVSPKALTVARKNARHNKVSGRIKFIKNNLLEKIPIPRGRVVIAANLPYLTKQQLKEKSIKFEPRAALYGGKDGLKHYERLLKQIKKYSMFHAPCYVLLEIDPSQTAKIKKLIKKYLPHRQAGLPQGQVEIKKDLAGQNRVVTIASNYAIARFEAT